MESAPAATEMPSPPQFTGGAAASSAAAPGQAPAAVPVPAPASPQTTEPLALEILQRLAAVEQENRALKTQVAQQQQLAQKRLERN